MIEQRKYWDSVAYDKNFTIPLHTELLDKHLPDNSKIIDLGCGYGRSLDELYRIGYRDLYGVDFSDKMIERGSAKNPMLNLKVMHGERTDFDDERFDAALVIAVLTCIPEDEGQDKLLGEAVRLLKPGGFIYINDFLLNEDTRNVERYSKHEDDYGKYGIFEMEGVVMRHHDDKRVSEMISQFKQVAYGEELFTTMNGNKAKGFYFMGMKG